jgi:hypothetical protein
VCQAACWDIVGDMTDIAGVLEVPFASRGS